MLAHPRPLPACVPLLLTLSMLLLGARAAPASSAVPMSLRELAHEAGQVVLGEVVETRARWAGGRIVTDVVLAVQRTLKGQSRERVTLEVLGGEVGDVGQRVHGEATFRRGETVVVFLHERRELLRLRGSVGGVNRGGVNGAGAAPAGRRLTVLGMAQGKLSVHPGKDGRLRVRRDLAGLELGPAAASTAIEGMELERFLESLAPHLRPDAPLPLRPADPTRQSVVP